MSWASSSEPGSSRGPRVWIALGSNVGDSKAQITKAALALQAFSEIPIRQSSLWETEPVDCPPGSPSFINAAVELLARAAETPQGLLQQLQNLEREFGRRPKQVLNEPRPLDLDLIAFGDLTLTTPELTLPHPRAHLRAFVLGPLAELAPDLILPGQALTVRELLKELPPGPQARKLVSKG